MRFLPLFVFALLANFLASPDAVADTVGNLTVTYTSASDIPVTASSVTISGGSTAAFTLGFPPVTGTDLMVVKNTGLGFITGTYSNLAHGQSVALNYGGLTYDFVANYYGGTGNDLVLVWKKTRLMAWGYNSRGQLGNHTTLSNMPPEVTTSGVLAGKTVVAAAAGAHHSLVLCSDGTLAAWGRNSEGQLGNSTWTDSYVPVPVHTSGALSGKTVVAIAAGTHHSLALCSDGALATWGYNWHGQLGNDSTANSSVPVAVAMSGALSSRTVVAIAAGANHSMALCLDGTLTAWGDNGSGQLGNNSTALSGVPVAVAMDGVLSGKTVVALTAGSAHSLALCSDGTLAAWGRNSEGQLGNNSTTLSNVPVAVATNGLLFGRTVAAISAGSAHSMALCSDGTVAAWGRNADGQLGNNSTAQSGAPVMVATNGVLAGKIVVAISAGSVHSLALCSDGTLAVWGRNAEGQFGDGSTGGSLVPVVAFFGDRFTRGISGQSAFHSIALVTTSAVPPLTPTVTTKPATAITTTTATLNGTVNPNHARTTVAFEYGLTSSYGATVIATPSPVNGSGNVAVSATINGLSLGTVIHYRLVATNSEGTTYGSNATYVATTLPPTVTTGTATAITATTATLNGVVNPNSASTTVTFQYGHTTSYGTTVTATPSPVNGTGNVAVSAVINGLSPGTVVHFRLVATNSAGTTYGNDAIFIPTEPVATGIATEITATTATLNGMVNPNGTSTTVTFEYGPTTSYGTTVTATPSPVNGTGNVAVSAPINGLSLGTVIHFRVVATNSAGTTYGDDATFIAAAPTTVRTGTATAIGGNTATLNGVVNPNGLSTIVTFYYSTFFSSGTVTATPSPVNGLGDVAVSANISGLPSDTSVAFRVVATNSAGTTYGNFASFKTIVPQHTVTTGTAGGITSTTAILNGVAYVEFAGLTFEYGPTTSYGSTVSASPGVVGGGGVRSVAASAMISGLLPGTVVHFRLVASRSYGAIYGSDATFTTPVLPPTVTTGIATATTDAAATLNGVVNPNGDSTMVAFEYGPTTSYGSTVTATPSPVNGNGNIAVSAAISGLSPETVVHYRLVATNSKGTTYGNDSTLSLIAAPPAPTVTAPTSAGVTHRTAILGANVTNEGLSMITGRGVVYSRTATNSDPVIGGNGVTVIPANGTTGVFTVPISGLASGTAYTFKAYAINSAGTTYTSTASFSTLANNAPVAANDAFTVAAEDTMLTVPAPGVLSNDTDANLDPLSALVVAGPSSGTLILNPDGSFTYTPIATFNGTDSFTYKANDSEADSNVATVTITVAPAAHLIFFTDWQALQWPGIADPAIIGAFADPDGDGSINLVEWALGTAGNTSDRPALVMDATDEVWTFTYTRPRGRSGIVYSVEICADLAGGVWTTNGVTHEKIASGDPETWQATYPIGPGQVFFRVRIMQQ